MPSITQGDLLVIRQPTKYSSAEVKEVVEVAGDSAAVLYQYYRMASLYKDSCRVSDEVVADALGWPTYKAARYRRALEKAAFIRISNVGTGTTKITKIVVGKEAVALFDAGLPHNIVDINTFKEVMRSLGINASQLPQNLPRIQVEMARRTI